MKVLESQNPTFKIFENQTNELKVIADFEISVSRDYEFKNLVGQNPEFKILVIKEMGLKILADFKILVSQNSEFTILVKFKTLEN